MLEIQKFAISGPLLITLKSFKDDRGFFVERFNANLFSSSGLPTNFLQDNFSRSASGVLRGLHCQHSPTQMKLVTCMSGKVQDVVVDLRKKSPTFGKHLSVNLSGDQPQWLLVPGGFAHGFLVLSSEPADVLYKVDSYYSPSTELAILWDDADLKLPWLNSTPVLSPKDSKANSWVEFLRVNPF